MKNRVIFVDDQPNVLHGLKRLLYSHRDEWEMTFVESGEAALATLRERPHDVIVTDMKMPGMNGMELLAAVCQDHPHMVRIILSGQSDLEHLERSFGLFHQYLSKPCDADVLKARVARACALRSRLADDSLRQLVAQVDSLPSAPRLYAQVVAELQSKETSLQRVAELIAGDVAMTTKVLQLVNSTFFGVARRVETASQAVTYLGLDLLRTLVFTVDVFCPFEPRAVRGYSIDQFTAHSQAVSQVAGFIASQLTGERRVVSEARLAGTMHDVGQLVMAASHPENFQAALDKSLDERLALYKAEQILYGHDHAAMGAHLLAMWGLADDVVEAVACHHEPAQIAGVDAVVVTAVHAANALVNRSTGSPFAVSEEIDRGYLERCGVIDRLPAWEAYAHSVVCQEIAS